MAVLYRTVAQSRSFEEILRRLGIRYRVVGGFSFYERAEVRNALAYIRMLFHPEDDVALLRVLNVPPRGIGKTTLDAVRETARADGSSLWAAIGKFISGAAGGRAVANLRFNAWAKYSNWRHDEKIGSLMAQVNSPALFRKKRERRTGHPREIHPISGGKRIVLEGGKAAGIALKDGRTVRARQFVTSTLDVRQTFETLIGRAQLPAVFLNKLDKFRYTQWSIFGLHLALHEPVRFHAEKFDPNIYRTLKWSLGAETMEDLLAAHKDVSAGRVPKIVQFGNKDTQVRACGSCHLPTGTGHDESAYMAGLPVNYFVRQMTDWKSGDRA